MRPCLRKCIRYSGYTHPESRAIEQRIRHWLESARVKRRVEITSHNWREYLERRRDARLANV